MLYAFIWCGLWGRQQWARQRMCREGEGKGVWSVNQNSNCNWSLTSIIAFNYIYLFARRLLSCPTCPSLPGSPLYHIPHGVVPCRCCWWRHDDDASDCACACAGQLAIGFGWRPCRLVSLWFAFHLCMRPGHVYYFISFHFISFEFFPSPARFIMIIMFYSTIDAQIGSCLDHLQLYTRGGRQQQQQKQRVGSLSGGTCYASGV